MPHPTTASHAAPHAHASVPGYVGPGHRPELACLEGLHRLADRSLPDQVSRHASGLQHTKGVRPQVAGKHGLGALAHDKLGSLNACTASLVHSGVGNSFELERLGIHKHVGRTPSKDRARRCVQVFALRRYYDFHLPILLPVNGLVDWELVNWGLVEKPPPSPIYQFPD